MGDLTQNFSRREFTCHCGCGANDIDLGLVNRLQLLRDVLDTPIRINSGVRCKAHNEAIGGSPRSKHVRGLAADISVPLYLLPWLYGAAKALWLEDGGGLGLYPEQGFVHFDVRSGRASWGEYNESLGAAEAELRGQL